jgi:hypothetical protein
VVKLYLYPKEEIRTNVKNFIIKLKEADLEKSVYNAIDEVIKEVVSSSNPDDEKKSLIQDLALLDKLIQNDNKVNILPNDIVFTMITTNIWDKNDKKIKELLKEAPESYKRSLMYCIKNKYKETAMQKTFLQRGKEIFKDPQIGEWII